MDNKSDILVKIAYIYIALPIIIFFIGWCNPLTAIFGTTISIVSLFFLFKNAPKLWVPNNLKQKLLLLAIFLITLLWVYSSGIGALVFQNMDHNCRNPIFELLVSQPWPVLHESQPAILTYYIGFWLPSAIIGKIFNSIQIGYYCQILWATLGISLFFYLVLANLRKKNLFPIILFIFFSGLDIIGTMYNYNPFNLYFITSHLEHWFYGFQFSSMTTLLYWVFNQAVAPWLVVMLLVNEKNNKSTIFLYSCLFLQGTLPAIGMLPLVAYWCIKNDKRHDDFKYSLDHIKNSIISLCTFPNIIGALFITAVSYFYLSNNISSGTTGVIGSNEDSLELNYLYWFLTFFMMEAGIYLMIIFHYFKKNPLYYIIILCLLFYPFIRIGAGIDFCMRATIPALTLLYLFIAKILESRFYRRKYTMLYAVLIIILCIGAVTPIHEMSRTIVETRYGNIKAKSNLGFDNFYGWNKNNKFLKYFGKNIKN